MERRGWCYGRHYCGTSSNHIAGDADTESITNAKELGPSKSREHQESSTAEFMRNMKARMNCLLDKHGFVQGASPPMPRRQKASRRKEDQILKGDKNDANHSKHLVGYFNIFIDHTLITSQEYVWNLFKSVYDTEYNKDFGGYLLATVNQVKVFKGGGPGPGDDHP